MCNFNRAFLCMRVRMLHTEYSRVDTVPYTDGTSGLNFRVLSHGTRGRTLFLQYEQAVGFCSE
jgi:hypothetical protein